MKCPDCGQTMTQLPNLYFSSGKKWLGCDSCDQVFEHLFNSFSGKTIKLKSANTQIKPYLEKINK